MAIRGPDIYRKVRNQNMTRQAEHQVRVGGYMTIQKYQKHLNVKDGKELIKVVSEIKAGAIAGSSFQR